MVRAEQVGPSFGSAVDPADGWLPFKWRVPAYRCRGTAKPYRKFWSYLSPPPRRTWISGHRGTFKACSIRFKAAGELVEHEYQELLALAADVPELLERCKSIPGLLRTTLGAIVKDVLREAHWPSPRLP